MFSKADIQPQKKIETPFHIIGLCLGTTNNILPKSQIKR